MLHPTRTLTLAFAAIATSACSDSGILVDATSADQISPLAVNSGDVVSSVRWSRLATALYRSRGGNPGRPDAYLSLAQYRAVVAVHNVRGGIQPSPAAAAAGASAVVLKHFYPLDAAAISAELAAQRVEPHRAGVPQDDFAAGEAIGHDIGAAVLAFAATDNFGATNPGLPPVLFLVAFLSLSLHTPVRADVSS